MSQAPSGYAMTLSENWARNLNQESPSGKASVAVFSRVPTFRYVHSTTFDMPVTYVLTAYNATNPNDACAATFTVTIKADPDFTRKAQRGVIPIVGKTPGLNGADFRTSLTLIGNPSHQGRLVFHPMGQAASDADPSIPYSFTQTNTVLKFDDLMAAFGRTGIGSLDIIPEGSNLQLPDAKARIYNQAADGGTYGTIEPLMVAAEWMGLAEANVPNSITTGPIPEGMRLNLGILNVAGGTTGVMLITHPDGTVITRTIPFFENQQLFLGTPAQLAAPFDAPIGPGDRIELVLEGGASIPFYTLTDNKTNDPAIAFAHPNDLPGSLLRLSN